MELLQTRYQQVLRQRTADAFTDGKTSHDYRRARFEATLNHFGLGHELIDELLGSYEKTLVQNLTPKLGALFLLRALKASGRKIVVITEGPEDAQERALRDLGLSPYVDFLATTNRFRVSKIDGLFEKVLDHLHVPTHDIAYVGDSMERDIAPAAAAGIYAIHLNEKQLVELDVDPVSVQALGVLEGLLG